jgi:hypothetical protein
MFSPNRPDRLWGQPSLLFNGLPPSFTEVRRTEREADLSPPSSTEVEWKIHGVVRDKSIFLHKPTNVSLEKEYSIQPFIFQWCVIFILKVSIILT